MDELFTEADLAALPQPPIGVGSPVRLRDGRTGLVVRLHHRSPLEDDVWLVKADGAVLCLPGDVLRRRALS